jgi:hypothetical protein
MAKNKTINTSYDLGYSARNENHDTIRDIRINFENPDDEFLMDNLNTWLRAIGVGLEVVEKKVV